MSYECEYDPTTAENYQDDDPSSLMQTFGWETKYNAVKQLMDDDTNKGSADTSTNASTTTAYKAIHGLMDDSTAEQAALAGAHTEAYQAIKRFMDDPIVNHPSVNASVNASVKVSLNASSDAPAPALRIPV